MNVGVRVGASVLRGQPDGLAMGGSVVAPLLQPVVRLGTRWASPRWRLFGEIEAGYGLTSVRGRIGVDDDISIRGVSLALRLGAELSF